MKKAFFFILIFSFLQFIYAQQSSGQQGSGAILTAFPTVPFNGNIQTAGMGEIGVVSSPIYYASGLTQNPALLARNREVIGGQITYSPWLRDLGFNTIQLLNAGIFASLNEKLSVGYHNHFFSMGGEAADNLGIDRVTEMMHGIRMAFALSEGFSIGAGLNHGYTNLGVATSANSTRSVNTVSGDVGLLYHSMVDLTSQTSLFWSVGLGIRNMGPKVRYSTAAAGDFIPTQAQLGIMGGYYVNQSENMQMALELAYQTGKMLVPSEGGRSDKSALAGMFSSFGDAPGGAQEERQEFVHQLGLEARMQRGSDFLLAFRTGLFLEHENKGFRRYFTLGTSIGAYGLRADFAYLSTFQQNHPLQKSLRVGLSLVMDIKEGGLGFMKAY